jgi:predicted Zn-dependent protease
MGLLSMLSPALADDTWQMPARFSRPSTDTDEGGLWALMDREEAKLRRSRFLIKDKELREYVSSIVCRLAGEHCPGVRVYLLQTPYFNASMAPNGMMQVWSGLLLRMGNEAQLAAVLGHEIGHYLSRHSVERLRDAKSRSAFGQFLGIALGAAGAGGAGAVSQLLLLAGMFSYTRDQEREADRIGLGLMKDAGYPPLEASRVWAQLIEEQEAQRQWTGESDNRSVLFATHPLEEERKRSLAEMAAAMETVATDTGEQAYREILSGYRRSFLEDELRRRKPGETLTLLDRMLRQEPGEGELHFFRGETFRLRNDLGDVERALEAYAQAERSSNPPPELYRAKGLLYRQGGQEKEASGSFRRYLELKPNAEDAELMKTYIREDA